MRNKKKKIARKRAPATAQPPAQRAAKEQRYPDAAVLEAASRASSVREIAEILGCSPQTILLRAGQNMKIHRALDAMAGKVDEPQADAIEIARLREKLAMAEDARAALSAEADTLRGEADTLRGELQADPFGLRNLNELSVRAISAVLLRELIGNGERQMALALSALLAEGEMREMRHRARLADDDGSPIPRLPEAGWRGRVLECLMAVAPELNVSGPASGTRELVEASA